MKVSDLQAPRLVMYMCLHVIPVEATYQPNVRLVGSAGVWTLMARRSLGLDSMEFPTVVSFE